MQLVWEGQFGDLPITAAIHAFAIIGLLHRFRVRAYTFWVVRFFVAAKFFKDRGAKFGIAVMR